MFLTAREMSLNKGQPISKEYRHRWTEKTARECGRHNMMFLQMYISKHRKELLYDEKIHGQIDVVSYVINRDRELSEEDKDFYLFLNLGRIRQLMDDGVKDILLFMTPKSVLFPTSILSQVETMCVSEVLDQIDDTLEVVDKSVIFVSKGSRPVIVSDEALMKREKECFVHNYDINYKKFLVDFYRQSELGDFLFFDMEYRREESREGRWTRVHTECAIMDKGFNFIYSGSMIDDNDMYEFIMRSLAGKIVFIKGAAAEMDYFDRLFSPYVFYSTKDYKDKRKLNVNARNYSFVIVDLDVFSVDKYPCNKHVPEKELFFFRNNLDCKMDEFVLSLRNNNDSIVLSYEKRAYDLLVFRWSWFFGHYSKVARGIYEDKFYRFLLYPVRLSTFSANSFDIDITSLSHQKMLFYFSYCDIYFHHELYCYFHNEKKCNKCGFYARSSRYSYKCFENDIRRDMFITYVNYVTGGSNGMYLSDDRDFYEYFEAFNHTELVSLFDLICDEKVDLLTYIKN